MKGRRDRQGGKRRRVRKATVEMRAVGQAEKEVKEGDWFFEGEWHMKGGVS